MIHKIFFVLMCLAAARSAAVDTHNPNSVQVPKFPAPIYEDNDISKHRESKIIPYSFSNEKYAQISNNGAFLTQGYPTIYSSPIHNPVYYNPTYSVATPVSGQIYHHGIPVLTKTYSTPVLTKTYSTPVLTKTYSTPVLTKTYSTPVLTKTYSTPVLTKTPGLLAYSHPPVVHDHGLKSTITYSEAPLVSHMTFTGLGTSYSW